VECIVVKLIIRESEGTCMSYFIEENVDVLLQGGSTKGTERNLKNGYALGKDDDTHKQGDVQR
jgi:hypothetical protein